MYVYRVFISYCCCKNNHKPSNFKQHKLSYCSKGQMSKMGLNWLKSKYWPGCVFFYRLYKVIHVLTFPRVHFLAHDLLSYSKETIPGLAYIILLYHYLCIYEDTCEYIRTILIMHINFPITQSHYIRRGKEGLRIVKLYFK